jgi:hypothetical protein
MKLIVFILFFSLPFSLISQESKLLLGFEGGLGSTNMSVSYMDIGKYKKPHFGCLIGMNIQYAFSEKLAIKTGINWERKSYKFKNRPITDIVEWRVTDTYTFDYLVIPIMGQLSIGKSRNYYIAGGIYNAILFKNKESRKKQLWGHIPIQGYNDYYEEYSRFDFGFSFGIGYKKPIDDKFFLTMELRNNYGVQNILKNSLNILYSNTTLGMIGVAFNINNKKEKLQ